MGPRDKDTSTLVGWALFGFPRQLLEHSVSEAETLFFPPFRVCRRAED